MTTGEGIYAALALIKILLNTIKDMEDFDPNKPLEILPTSYDEILALAKLKKHLPDSD